MIKVFERGGVCDICQVDHTKIVMFRMEGARLWIHICAACMTVGFERLKERYGERDRPAETYGRDPMEG